MGSGDIKQFPGEKITVSWDERLCIHVAECGKADDDLFVAGREPWCQPDSVDPQRVVAVCERCPSGALSVSDASGASVEQAPDRNTVQIINDGPLYVRGQIALQGAPDDMPGIRHRVALCRCGNSANKPFCDNSHRAGFEDAGAIGESGPGFDDAAGPLSISAAKDGPLVLNGPVELVAGTGRTAWKGEKLALCRCGESKTKPFCDGSHQKVGFRSG